MASRGRPSPRRPASGRSVLVALAAAAVLAAAACARAPRTVALVFVERTSYWSAVEEGARRAAAEAGVALTVHVAGGIEPSADVRSALADAGAVVLSSEIAAGERPPGRPAVVIGPEAPPGVTRVDADHVAAGEQAGAALAALLEDGQEVLVLDRGPRDPPARERERAALESLRLNRPRAVVRIDRRQGEAGADRERARGLLRSWPDARAAFASDAAGAAAFLAALRDEGRAGGVRLVACGAESLPEIAQGLQDGTVAAWVHLAPEAVGRGAIQAALRLLEGEAPPPVLLTAVARSSGERPAVPGDGRR